MKYVFVEVRKYRGSFLLKVCLAAIILQFTFVFGLITSFDESYQMWKSVVDKAVSPSFFFMYQAQKCFFYSYAIIIIGTCGYIQNIENRNNTWDLLINLPVEVLNIILAKIILSFVVILIVSAIMVTTYFAAFSIATTVLPLLRETNMPDKIWFSWLLHFTAMLPVPLLIMHFFAVLTKGRVSVFTIGSILIYVILSLMKLAPGILILEVGTTPLASYLDLIEITTILSNNLLAIGIIFGTIALFRDRLVQYISQK